MVKRAPSQLPGLLFAAGFICILGSLCVAGWQAAHWLRAGEWPELPLTYVLGQLTGATIDSWLVYPRDWLGVHKALSWFSLSGGLVTSGALLCFFASAADN